MLDIKLLKESKDFFTNSSAEMRIYMNNINIISEDFNFSNKKFWLNFIALSFPTALDRKTDMSLSEIIEETIPTDIEWWDNFTGYYDGILDESDGYIDNPKTFTYNLTSAQILKIEFHPCDIVYYINNNQIGCTGGEYSIFIFPFADLFKYTQDHIDDRIFLLLLPLTVIHKQDVLYAAKKIYHILCFFFDETTCNQLTNSILYGLMEEE